MPHRYILCGDHGYNLGVSNWPDNRCPYCLARELGAKLAAAEAKAQQAEDELTEARDTWGETCDGLRRDREELSRKLAAAEQRATDAEARATAAERDAARWRGLCALVEQDHDEYDSEDGVTLAKTDTVCSPGEDEAQHGHVYVLDTAEDNWGDGSLDALIDAAMATGAGAEGGAT